MKRNRPSNERDRHDADDQWLCKRSKEKTERPSGRTSAFSGRRRIPSPSLKWLHGKSNGETEGGQKPCSQTRQSSLLAFLSPQPGKGKTMTAGALVKVDTSQSAAAEVAASTSTQDVQEQTASIYRVLPPFTSRPSPSKQTECWEDREGHWDSNEGRGTATDSRGEEGTSSTSESDDSSQVASSSLPKEVTAGSNKEWEHGLEDSALTSNSSSSLPHILSQSHFSSIEESSSTEKGEASQSNLGLTDLDESVDCLPYQVGNPAECITTARTLNPATLQFSQSSLDEADSYENDSQSLASSLPQTLVLTCSDVDDVLPQSSPSNGTNDTTHETCRKGSKGNSVTKITDELWQKSSCLEDDLTPTFEDSCWTPDGR